MHDNKNHISNEMASCLDKFTDWLSDIYVKYKLRGNKDNYYYEIINNFKEVLENDNLIDKIKGNDEQNDRVYEIYYLIKDKFIEKD